MLIAFRFSFYSGAVDDDLNFHNLAVTRPSSVRVYQFRHHGSGVFTNDDRKNNERPILSLPKGRHHGR